MESWFLMGQGRSDGAEQLGGRSLTDLRDHNQAAVLDCLVTATQPVTIRRLQELTGLTRPTVSAAMNSLLEQGDALEQESMHAGGRGGRRSRMFTLNATKRVQAGAAIRLQGVELGLADWHGEMLASTSRPLRGGSPGALLDEALDDLLQELGLDSVDTMVIGALGSVGPDGRLRHNESLPEISDPDHFTALHDGRVGNVMIENDAVLAALAEQHVRGLADTESMVSLLIDASVGAGIILDGRAIRGSAGYAGEMSYLPGAGWATAHLDLVDAAARHDVSAEALFELAGSPHAPVWAEQAVDAFADAIVPGVAALLAALDPGLLVIGGHARPAHVRIARRLRASLRDDLPHLPYIEASRAGAHAVVQGAVELALAQLEASTRQV